MRLLEKLVETVAPDMHKSIGKRLDEKRDYKNKISRVHEILADNGVKVRYETWLETDWNGKLKQYPITPTIGQPYFNDDLGRYCLIPVRYDRKAGNDVWNQLYLVDLRNKIATSVSHSGDRGIHYHGSFSYKPFAIAAGSNKVIVAFEEKLRPRIADLFDGDFWYFLSVRRPLFRSDRVLKEVQIGEDTK